MKAKEVRELSYYIISEYYNNNLKPFFEYLDEDVAWWGPAEGQVIFSKKNMTKIWSKEKHNLKFTMSDTKDRVVPINKTAISVILSYDVYTHYPSGVNHMHRQNIDITWIERKVKGKNGKLITKPFIRKMFIANVHKIHEKDTIYAVNSENETFQYFKETETKRIIVRDKNGAVHHILANHIIYVEKRNEGRHSTIHTINDDIECMEKTVDILKQSDNFFLSPHISFLVNPIHIKKVERFQVILDNDVTLPIAEKKYTKFKSTLKKYISNYSKT